MSSDDVQFLKEQVAIMLDRQRRQAKWIIAMAVAFIPVGFAIGYWGVTDHADLKHKADKEFVQEYTGGLVTLTTELATTLNNYITADEEDKAEIKNQLVEIRNRLNNHINGHIGPYRSTVDCEGPFYGTNNVNL
jgi:hypothetical protein